MNRSHRFVRFLPAMLLGLSLSSLVACTGTNDPELEIDQIQVTGETDGISALDVEVHVFDADTDEWLGCAGQEQGLEQVDQSDVTYDVSAFPEDGGGFRLRDSDLFGRNIYFEVIEDDIDPCPAPPNFAGGDDLIGDSGPISGDSLGAPGLDLAFGRVDELGVTEY
jgi:hypothetical protein